MLYSYKTNYPEELPESITAVVAVFEEVTHDVVTDENGYGETITVTETMGRMESVTREAPFEDFFLAEAGYVLAPDKPDDTDFLEYVWTGRDWLVEETEASKVRTQQWITIRKTRNEILTQTDVIIDTFIDNDEEILQEWIDYRTALRNLPQTYETGEIDDWQNVVFPSVNHTLPEPEEA